MEPIPPTPRRRRQLAQAPGWGGHPQLFDFTWQLTKVLPNSWRMCRCPAALRNSPERLQDQPAAGAFALTPPPQGHAPWTLCQLLRNRQLQPPKLHTGRLHPLCERCKDSRGGGRDGGSNSKQCLHQVRWHRAQLMLRSALARRSAPTGRATSDAAQLPSCSSRSPDATACSPLRISHKDAAA